MRTEELARWILLSYCVSFLGGFQADRVDEIIQSLYDGSISSIESRDLLFQNGSVIGKELQNAGREWRVNFFTELQKHQAVLIALGAPTVLTPVSAWRGGQVLSLETCEP